MATVDWNVFSAALEGVENVVVTTHVRPDADALGSELGVAAILRHFGKRVTIFNSSPTPERYRFLDPTGSTIKSISAKTPAPTETPDLILTVDTGTWSQLAGMAEWVRNSPARKFVIDHHVTQDDLGGERLVDVSAAACGVLIFEAFVALGVPIDRATATPLFAAIAMDTGWMHHSNTDPRALRSLAVLVERGAAPAEIYRQLFERNSPSRYRLMGTLFNRIERELEGRLSHATVRWNDIGAAGAHPMDTEDFVQLLMGIDGVETALLFIEQEGGGTKVSFRSRGRLDCAATAGLFGGGGHQLAAGASVADAPEIIRGKILRVVRERLGAAVERPPIAAT